MAVTGRVALVSGATSGLGAEVARNLARHGARVAIAGRDASRGAALAAELQQRGGAAAFVPHDLFDPASAAAAAAAAAAALGPVEILVCNAATYFFGPFLDVTVDEACRAFEANVLGTLLLTQAVLPGMVERERGRVVFITSVGAEFGTARGSLYAMSKAALLGLMRALVAEFGPYGITVNAVGPGLIHTPLTEPVLGTAEQRAEAAASHPSGRLGTPEDVAHVVRMLVDDEAGHVAASHILVDGGKSLMTGTRGKPPPTEAERNAAARAWPTVPAS
jgi:NAD(P)-dependent dehydrogenase (short-subunit alcohol dehydrogenase family)